MEIKSHPRFNVDDQLSDLRELRSQLAEILIASHALISLTKDMPDQVAAQVREAVSAIDLAGSVVRARMNVLYAMKNQTVPPMYPVMAQSAAMLSTPRQNMALVQYPG